MHTLNVMDASISFDREVYLPEDYYFVDTRQVPVTAAVRQTARFLAHWADSYEAQPLTAPKERREGRLPQDVGERLRVVDELVDWLVEVSERSDLGCLSLMENGEWLLDGHDGLPGRLVLAPERFFELQQAWEAQGLPRDLYYPAPRKQLVIEAKEMYGGVVRVTNAYSPLQFAHRVPKTATLTIPGEKERIEEFVRACDRFVLALRLRFHELMEPGRERDEEEIRELHMLRAEVVDAATRAKQKVAALEGQSSEK